MRASLPTLLSLVAAVLALSGCGGSDSTGTTATDESSDQAGAIIHVAGTLRSSDDGFVLTPASGDETITFSLGPEVERAVVRALEASGTTVRVSYRPTEDAPVAASVEPAPALGEELETYEGQVVSVDAKQIVIDGEDGKRSFDISGAGDAAFDAAHLLEHAERDEPILVYFDPKAPRVGIAYEDA